MKRLILVTGEASKEADPEVLYLGSDRAKAKEVFGKAVEDGKLSCVMLSRIMSGNRKYPAKMAERRKLDLLEREAAELPAKLEAARGALQAAGEKAEKAAEKAARANAAEKTKAAAVTAEAEVEEAAEQVAKLEEREAELQKLGFLELPDLDPEAES